MSAISDLIHTGANDVTGILTGTCSGNLTGDLTGNFTGATSPTATPLQSGERRRAMVARDLGLLHCCEGVASAFLGYYRDYGEVCQQGLQTMLDLCLDPTNRLKLGDKDTQPPPSPSHALSHSSSHSTTLTPYHPTIHPTSPTHSHPSSHPSSPSLSRAPSVLPDRTSGARNSPRFHHDQYHHEKEGQTWPSGSCSL